MYISTSAPYFVLLDIEETMIADAMLEEREVTIKTRKRKDASFRKSGGDSSQLSKQPPKKIKPWKTSSFKVVVSLFSGVDQTTEKDPSEGMNVKKVKSKRKPHGYGRKADNSPDWLRVRNMTFDERGKEIMRLQRQLKHLKGRKKETVKKI